MALLLVALVAGTLATAPLASAAPRPPGASWPADAVPGSLLVTTRAGEFRHVEVPPGTEATAAARLLSRADVVDVEPDRVRSFARTPDDPGYARQWAHRLANADDAWDVTTGSRAVQVAVIDSGVDGTHPDLGPNLVAQYDVSGGEAVPTALGSDNDRCGHQHGTFVAGVVGAVGGNGSGLAGVSWEVGLVDIAVTGAGGCDIEDSAVLRAIDLAIGLGVDVVNLSLGTIGDSCPTAYDAAVRRARAAEVVVVAAAGNEQLLAPGATGVPASCNGVLSVGASRIDGTPASYSSANEHVDLAAPGGDADGQLLGLAPGGATTEGAGTSYAAPYVAGAAALLRAADPGLTADQVERLLEKTASGGGRRTPELGWGVVDVGGAVLQARSGRPAEAPAADPPFPVGLFNRLSAQRGTTEPIRQAVASSRFAFRLEGQSPHAVLARADDYADALAGSALAFGAGPVLFTSSTGPLDPVTAEELRRVVEPGGTVYLLGGTAALPAGLDAEVQAMGLNTRRFAGTNRFATAALVADEVVRVVQSLGFDRPQRALLATGFSWPDAVVAGSIGAWFGEPVLLTEPGSLHPDTAAALDRLRPRELLVVGGTSVVSDPVFEAARGAAGGSAGQRLAGADRSGTAIVVAFRMIRDVRAQFGADPDAAVAVNLRRPDGYAHVLSASAIIGARSGIFLPVEGERGDVVPDVVKGVACNISPGVGLAIGDVDLVSEEAKVRLSQLLEHDPSACG